MPSQKTPPSLNISSLARRSFVICAGFCLTLLGFPSYRDGSSSSKPIWTFGSAAGAQILPGVKSSKWYGVIEIGSKGVKGHVFDLDRARSAGCKINPEIYRKCLSPKTIVTIDANAVDRAQILETVRAADLVKQAILSSSEYGIVDDRLFVVGSSGLARVDHKLELAKAIDRALARKEGEGHKIDFVSDEEEPQYAFKGIMGMLPARYQTQRQEQAMVVDFGGGNVKGSYKNLEREGAVESFSIPWGTKTITQYLNNSRGGEDFNFASEKFRQSVLVPLIRQEFSQKTYAATRPRIYLVGGIVWAVSNLSQPRSTASFPTITIADIETTYARATAPNGIANLCETNPDLKVNADIARICKNFPGDQLIAGLQLLRTFASGMNFSQKKVFFFRDSQYAWPLGYLENKVLESR